MAKALGDFLTEDEKKLFSELNKSVLFIANISGSLGRSSSRLPSHVADDLRTELERVQSEINKILEKAKERSIIENYKRRKGLIK